MDYLVISSVYLLLESFFLISLRILGFFLVAPIFGGQNTHTAAKITIALTTAFILMTSQGVEPYSVQSPTIAAFFWAGIKELAVGLVMGFSVYFLLSMFYYIGQVVDFQIGFSMVSVFDPLNQIQIPISGNLFYLTISFLLILSGAHYNFFRALFYSYQVLPIGGAIFTNENIVQIFLNLFGTFFMFGFRTALPIVGTMLVFEICLGILNKASPQMHIFAVGMTLKIVVGLVLMYLLFPMFVNISDAVFLEINKTLYTVIRGMMQ